MQLLSQLVAGLVAILGATGYIIVLGAAVLWLRLQWGEFPKEVPISLASREELLVMGAQALAVWVVLALALAALASRMVSSETLKARDIAASLGLGFSVSVVTLSVLEVQNVPTIASVAAVGILVLAVSAYALWYRPPVVTWITPLVTVLVGFAMPVIVHPLDATKTTPTVITAWLTFAAVIVWLPAMQVHRRQIAANSRAISGLELQYPALRPDGAGNLPPTVARLATLLRTELRQARTRLWLRAIGIGA